LRQSDWITYYTAFGFDVFIYNYRGYGRSGGTPSPAGNNADGDAICEHLRTQLGVTQIIVHGESIGGLVANHCGAHCKIDMLIVDRTFSNLNVVASHLIGVCRGLLIVGVMLILYLISAASWAGQGLQFVTGWQTDNTANFIKAPCVKLICCDPNDEIICDASSLKVGVANVIELGKVKVHSHDKMYKNDTKTKIAHFCTIDKNDPVEIVYMSNSSPFDSPFDIHDMCHLYALCRTPEKTSPKPSSRRARQNLRTLCHGAPPLTKD
jgi:hypothetical protein